MARPDAKRTKEMAGEMSQSEVTPESYPALFKLRDSLKRRGIMSEPRAFDQYQGPYLNVPNVGRVWIAENFTPFGPLFTIERSLGNFEIHGARFIYPPSDRTVAYGSYTLRQASSHIAYINAGEVKSAVAWARHHANGCVS